MKKDRSEEFLRKVLVETGSVKRAAQKLGITERTLRDHFVNKGIRLRRIIIDVEGYKTALEAHGTPTQAALALGVPRSTFVYRCRNWGLL